jgi:hypothetical protein
MSARGRPCSPWRQLPTEKCPLVLSPYWILTVWNRDNWQRLPLVRDKLGSVEGVFMMYTGTPRGLLLDRTCADLE